MNPLERAVRRFDKWQAHVPVVAVPIAVVKKFGDDQGSRLAALIAYYGFFSLFPLLLVLVSALGYLLADDSGLRRDVLDSALGQFPVLGDAIRSGADVQPLQGNWVAIVVGSVTALWAGIGVAQAAGTAMNTVWDVPRAAWPNFIFRRIRALATLAVLATIVVISTVAGRAWRDAFGSPLEPFQIQWVISFVLNTVLFVFAYQLLTARQLRWPTLVPGAVFASVGWTALQAVGSYVVTNQISRSSDVYGVFALVLALLIWISLGAQVSLLGAEINVVWHRHLWPRNIAQPPLSDGDRRVYAAIVERARMRPEMEAAVRFHEDADGPTAPTADGRR